MDRKETTKLLTDILINDKLSDRKYYANTHKKWDLDLCEWRIKNCIPALTPRSAKKFLKEINKNQ